MAIEYVAGIDCSTQATKVVVVEVATGTVVAEGRGDHEVHFGEGSVAETDPMVWWRALATALADTDWAHRIDAVAVGGQQHGLVVTGDDGLPLRPAMLWCDLRATAEAQALVDDLGGPQAVADLTGSLPLASFTAPKWAWLRANQPDIARATRGVRLPHDWLTEQLTGEAVTDRGDASGTAWWSPAEGRYLDEVLELPALDLDPELLPRVLEPGATAGTVTARAADELGLRPGIPVGPGTGDNAAAALGLGLAQGTPVLSLGTSGTIYVRASEATADPSGAIAGFADAAGAFLPLICTQNCTLAIDAMTATLGLDREDVSEDTGVVALPYLEGERTPYLPHASGSIVGMRPTTTAQELLLATYRGAAAALLAGLDMLPGVTPEAPLVLIGGGARGATWQRVIGELSGRSLQIPQHTELVALGAAVQAAGIATEEDFETIAERWGTAAGDTVAAREARHDVTERIRYVDQALRVLNGAPLPTA